MGLLFRSIIEVTARPGGNMPSASTNAPRRTEDAGRSQTPHRPPGIEAKARRSLVSWFWVTKSVVGLPVLGRGQQWPYRPVGSEPEPQRPSAELGGHRVRVVAQFLEQLLGEVFSGRRGWVVRSRSAGRRPLWRAVAGRRRGRLRMSASSVRMGRSLSARFSRVLRRPGRRSSRRPRTARRAFR